MADAPPNPITESRLLTRRDLSAILCVSLKTVSKIQAGGFAGRPALRPVIRSGRCTRFRAVDLENWLSAGQEPPARLRRGRPRKYQQRHTV